MSHNVRSLTVDSRVSMVHEFTGWDSRTQAERLAKALRNQVPDMIFYVSETTPKKTKDKKKAKKSKKRTSI